MSRFPTRSLRVDTSDDHMLAIGVIAIAALARLLFSGFLDYGVDEAYAVSVARHFQWSFFDHPPIAFWTVGAMEFLFGSQAPHWLMRLPFVVAFSVTSYLIYDLTRRLFDARAGLWAVAALSTAPFFFASAGSWLVPDGPLDLWLAATAILLARILFADLTRAEVAESWLGAGLTFGLAGLSKYHALLFAFGAVVFIVATRHRSQLAAKAPWIAGILALAVISPLLVWNADNHWISFAFQSGRAGAAKGLQPFNVVQSLLGQAAYLLPWTLVALAYALVAPLAYRPKWLESANERERALFLAALALPAVALFTLAPILGGKGLPHWPMPGWLFAFPLLGKWLATGETRGSRAPAVMVTVSAAITAIAAFAVTLLLRSPLIATWALSTPGMLDGPAYLKPLYQEASDWQGLPAALADRDITFNDKRFAVALNWREAARIGAALGRSVDVAAFDADARGFAFLTDQKALLGRDAVIIGEWRPMLTIDDRFKDYFREIERPQLITLSLAGGIPRTMSVAVAHQLIKPFPLPYGATR
ncbi:MAG: glycosyltransferase family 39 protein [Ancalomicrobiaceae bacterium]|nr:glycosyltransferase family 39 protein [Ancalomicrobiaceae bacterium]